MTLITIDIKRFKACFPSIVSAYSSDEELELAIECAYEGVGGIINPVLGEIILTKEVQTRGVYLAIAHKMAISQNPNGNFRPVTSVNQGSEGASFDSPVVKNNLEYYLSTTPYGVELLAILSSVVPLLPSTPLNIYPYYN